CEESGVQTQLKQEALRLSRLGQAKVFTDPLCSPAGFPFKVAQIAQTLSDTALYENRPRICDLGYLRHPYRKPDGRVGYRCPAEPLPNFLRKGGTLADTRGRKCVCNGLPTTVGLGQVRPESGAELPLVTAGDDLALIAQFLTPGRDSYSAADVLRQLLAEPAPNS